MECVCSNSQPGCEQGQCTHNNSQPACEREESTHSNSQPACEREESTHSNSHPACEREESTHSNSHPACEQEESTHSNSHPACEWEESTHSNSEQGCEWEEWTHSNSEQGECGEQSGDQPAATSLLQRMTNTACATYEAALLDYEPLPATTDPVYLLGRRYSALYDVEEIHRDVGARVWVTYRRGFAAIGGVGPTSDTGWGCMLRCGQMMLAQTLLLRHLGRDGHRDPGDPTYARVLRMFADCKAATYSIHQISQMGVTEGKPVGSWFGPNTVAQVLRKLAPYDAWSGLAVHVAMDNSVIVDDIRALCLEGAPPDANRVATEPCGPADSKRLKDRENYSRAGRGREPERGRWKPLLLVVPLRLGLTEINPCYVRSVKECLELPQTVGIIGGKPNHAYYFLGYVGDQLLYLDPHTTQPVVDLDTTDDEGRIDDGSYHCNFISRMNFADLDPSVAIGFYFGSEGEFDSWCQQVQDKIIAPEKQAMFELAQQRPAHWFDYHEASGGATYADYTVLDTERVFDTDDEFELL